jgi:hypothetical protein
MFYQYEVCLYRKGWLAYLLTSYMLTGCSPPLNKAAQELRLLDCAKAGEISSANQRASFVARPARLFPQFPSFLLVIHNGKRKRQRQA